MGKSRYLDCGDKEEFVTLYRSNIGDLGNIVDYFEVIKLRFLTLAQVKPGQFLARTLYDEQCRILLKAGVELKTEYIERFKKLGLTGIYVRDEFTDMLDLADVVSEKTQMEAYRAIREVMCEVSADTGIHSREVMDTVKNLIDEIISSRKHLLTLNDLRMAGTYAMGHGVSVCITAVRIGLTLGYDQLKLKQLGIGALLHDVGKGKLDQAILSKSRLTLEEQNIIKRHTTEGFELIRANGEFSGLSAHVAFQHHEKYDGAGYPRGLKGEEITEYSRIVAVANVYDNLTHERHGQTRLLPHEAIDIMVNGMPGHFDPEMLTLLSRTIAIYPVGCQVKLNTGEICVVVRTHRDFPTKPAVRLIRNANRSDEANEVEYELAQHKERFVVEVLKV